MDYFDLSREVTAISLALFDRFFATGTCKRSSDTILLCSIATLHIAIKMRESAIIKLSTLAWFGRGKFSEDRITNMEQVVLSNLNWLANPPTALSFVMHCICLLPDDMHLPAKRKILKDSRFLAGMYVGVMLCLLTLLHAAPHTIPQNYQLQTHSSLPNFRPLSDSQPL